jgi:hydroxysqualene synthase
MAVDHYENFPVASVLCPPALRPPIAAIYHFARTADDIADEGTAPAHERLADLERFRGDLYAIAAGQAHSGRWSLVFDRLAPALERWRLPVGLLDDLLSAFIQDVDYTAHGRWYADEDALLDYCRRSAHPIGRLLLHLYGINDAPSLLMSDHICAALQLINFWQDLGVDIPRGRYYLPADACAAHGVATADLLALRQTAAVTRLIASCVQSAEARLQRGSGLALRVPGRAGWELRLVVQGGQRILDRIRHQSYTTLGQRPTLRAGDVALMLWRSLWMSPADGTMAP